MRFRQGSVLALLFAFAWYGCRSARPAAAPAAQPQTQATRGSEQTKPVPAQPHEPDQRGEPGQPGEAAYGEDVRDYMGDHFLLATWARNAVVEGDLESVRVPLRALAEYDYAQVAPGGWVPWVAKMQQAARLTADASTLDLASSGLAAMARVCGECHSATQSGPILAPSPKGSTRYPEHTLPDRMVRHAWAADQLWLGLIGPSDEAWHAGATALSKAPADTTKLEPELPPQFNAALLEVRALGQQALENTTLEARADTYGVLMASCAACHAQGVAFEW